MSDDAESSKRPKNLGHSGGGSPTKIKKTGDHADVAKNGNRSPNEPLDESYMPKIVKCESKGIVRSVSQRVLREASSSFDETPTKNGAIKDSPKREHERKVMVLYTGGTIGMKTHGGVYVPEPNYLPKAIRAVPHLHDQDYANHYFPNLEVQPYVLPSVHGEEKRVIYWLFEYEPLLDSSDMTFDDWIKIAKDIHSSYDKYDGFVILHGTDTLSYTASALSFMFENLTKPVIITGAQIPVVEVRSDGRENLIGALIIAGNYDIPEVCVYFNNKLMRGNRTSKVDNSGLDAFNSPNCPVLASMEVRIHVDWDNVFRCGESEKTTLQTNLNRKVGLLRIFPSVTIECIRAFLNPGLEGIVLQTFGAGNIPSRRKDLIDELKKAVDRGAIIVNCSQCYRGQVDAAYHTGMILYEIGVIAGSDMTAEAALTKLAYVLGKKDWDLAKKKKMMGKNLRGELTVTRCSDASKSDSDIVRKMAKFLQGSNEDELVKLRQALLPSLICSAASSGDLALLKKLKKKGAKFDYSNFDKRTALHAAASSGQTAIVEMLLSQKISPNTQDRYECTPLVYAVRKCNYDVIKLLVVAGAELKMNIVTLGTELCSCVHMRNLAELKAWQMAGADLNACDYDRRTPLHVACTQGCQEIVIFLLENGAKPNVVDAFGFTPVENAKKNKHAAIIELLESQ